MWGTVLRRRNDSQWIYKKYTTNKLTRVNIVGRRALSSEIVERPRHSDGLSRMDSMELAAVGLGKQGLPGCV